MNKSIIQLILEMRCCESLLNGAVRVGLEHGFIVEQLQKADQLTTDYNSLPHNDRYWADEMIADETYYALDLAVQKAREYVRSSFTEV